MSTAFSVYVCILTKKKKIINIFLIEEKNKKIIKKYYEKIFVSNLGAVMINFLKTLDLITIELVKRDVRKENINIINNIFILIKYLI